MTTIITRASKGEPLTNNELDQNFINLNIDKSEVATTVEKSSNTGGAFLPVGTTEERPIASAGVIRFNTTNNDFEGLTGTGWESLTQFPFSNIPPSAPGVANPGILEETSRADHVHPQDAGKANKQAETAAGTSFEPSGTLEATTVQAAIQELDTDIQNISGGGGGGTPSDSNPIMDGVAAPGTSTDYSRGDHVHPSDTSKAAASHSHTDASTSASGFMSAVDKTKLDGVESSANNYTHPTNHPPSIISQDASNRFVTDTEKATWNAKGNGTVTGVTGTAPIVSSGGAAPAISISAATTSAAGSMSAADKLKLDGVATGATNYTHPASHPPSIITQDSSNRFVTDAEKATWNAAGGGASVNTANTWTARQTFNMSMVEKRVNMAADVFDCSAGNYFYKTATGSTINFTVGNVPANGGVFSFIFQGYNMAQQTVVWPSGTRWASGRAPTMTAGTDLIGFTTNNGGVDWYAFVLGLGMA